MRIVAEISDQAHAKLIHEQQYRSELEGRGKIYPLWRILEELIHTLPVRKVRRDVEPDEPMVKR